MTTRDPSYVALLNQVASLELRLEQAEKRAAEAESARLEIAKNFSSLFDNSPEMILLSNPNGTITAANPAACEQLGWTEQEICSLGRVGVLDTSDPRFPVALEERQRTGRVRAKELTAFRKGGERFAVEVDSVIIPGDEVRSFVIMRDIRERKRAEEALRQSEQRFRLMGETLPYGVWLCDPDGRAIYTSQSFLDLLEMTMEEMQGFGWTHRLPPEDVEPMLAKWMHSVRTGENWDGEHRCLGPDGAYHTILSRGRPVRNEQGRITCWVGINLDIDDRKRMEEALREYARKLERSNKDLQEFAYVASHDLQEPLRKIGAFGNTLRRMSDDMDPAQREILDRMIQASNRLQQMVDDLLELSRVSTQERELKRVDLAAVAAEVLGDLEAQISRNGATIVVEELPVVEADPVQMRVMLQNLIGNALKYHQPSVAPMVKISGRPVSTRKVQIQVEDNGIGFEEQHLERIFQPFQRLVGRSAYEGSGMGLAICKKIVERHGGEITARSQPGAGSVFIVSLPQVTGAT